MKKSTIIIIFILAVFSFFGLYSLQKKQLSVSNTTPTLSTPPTNNQIEKIDYSTLEKDRLYTEEEGKYENLSDVGKKLLRTVLALPDCINDPTLSYCYEYEQQIKRSSIIALKNDVILVDIPSQKIGAFYKIYDLKQNKYVGKQMWHFDTNTKNKDLVIYVYDDDTSGQNLFYYRPGRRSFALVPNSKISSSESYWYNVGMGTGLPDITFKNDVFTISIFNKNEPREAGDQSKKLRDVTFNLDSIQ